MDEPQCTFVKLLRFLTSFSHVNLSLIPLNLENVTVKPRHITRLLSVPGLTTTLYIAFNKRFSELLHLHDDRTDDDQTNKAASRWIMFGAQYEDNVTLWR
jgi:hypothetical protein